MSLEPEKTFGQAKRPWMAAIVRSINPAPGNGCLTVSTMNAPSIYQDACGNSENLGHVSTFDICPPNSTAFEFTTPGGTPDCARNLEYKKCKETIKGWNQDWKVRNPFPKKQVLG